MEALAALNADKQIAASEKRGVQTSRVGVTNLEDLFSLDIIYSLKKKQQPGKPMLI